MPEKLRTDEEFIEKISKISPKELFFVKTEALTELNATLALIKSDITDDQRRCLTNYFAVRLVSWIENYFKNSVIWLIDHYGLEYPDFKLELKLPDLKKIQKAENFTAGKIVSKEMNFQNLGIIFGTINSILQINDFSDRVEKQNVDIGRISQILQIRHEIIHNFGNCGWNPDQCLEAKQTVFQLIYFCNQITIARLKELEIY